MGFLFRVFNIAGGFLIAGFFSYSGFFLIGGRVLLYYFSITYGWSKQCHLDYFPLLLVNNLISKHAMDKLQKIIEEHTLVLFHCYFGLSLLFLYLQLCLHKHKLFLAWLHLPR